MELRIDSSLACRIDLNRQPLTSLFRCRSRGHNTTPLPETHRCSRIKNPARPINRREAWHRVEPVSGIPNACSCILSSRRYPQPWQSASPSSAHYLINHPYPIEESKSVVWGSSYHDQLNSRRLRGRPHATIKKTMFSDTRGQIHAIKSKQQRCV